MIHFERVPEPRTFKRKARQPGKDWLTANPAAKRPKDLWTQFKPHLARGFRDLCAYSVMYEPVGCIDHFLSWKNHPDRAYDWSNYRYSSEWINKSKQNADAQVLDPYEVEDDWFEILLPSLQLVVSTNIPPETRERAEYTLRRLHLCDDERVLRQRREWYRMYLEGELTLEGLRRKAPLIARAVEKSATGNPMS